MKLRMLLVITLALVIALPMSALAQYEASNSSPLGVAVTTFRPSGSELQALETNWIGAALYYHAKIDQADRPRLVFSIGWLSSNDDTTGVGARVVPLRVNTVKRFGDEERCWYVSAGADLYFAHFERTELTDTGYRKIADNGTLFGYNVAGGRELGGGWFIEARRDMVGKLSHETGGSIDFSGWSLSFGSRFAY